MVKLLAYTEEMAIARVEELRAGDPVVMDYIDYHNTYLWPFYGRFEDLPLSHPIVKEYRSGVDTVYIINDFECLI